MDNWFCRKLVINETEGIAKSGIIVESLSWTKHYITLREYKWVGRRISYCCQVNLYGLWKIGVTPPVSK